MWEKIKEAVRHNQFIVMAIIIVAIVLLLIYGCESQTPSPWRPEVRVTRAELVAEIDMMNVKIKQAEADLDRQDAFKQELFDQLTVMAKGGTVNPVGVGLGMLGILGLGAVVDNRKKDAVIKTLQNGDKTDETTTK